MSPVPLPDGSSTADGNQSQSDARRLFDFNLSDAWEHENLSGEGTGDWYSEMNPAPIGGPGDNTHSSPSLPYSEDRAFPGLHFPACRKTAKASGKDGHSREWKSWYLP